MKIKKLDASFYTNNKHLKEVMDKTHGVWDVSSKTRGYGIVTISIKSLTFGIPLRSGIKHKDCFTITDNKGLDYSKAVLLMDSQYISNESFLIPNKEFLKIKDKEFFIKIQFEKYVGKYINAIRSGDENKINKFRFSTLCNYHAELGI